MENHSYSQIIGSSSAPYINSLAKTYGNATQMFAESHPSLPNYIAMTSGGTQGITDDNGPSAHPLSVPSIFSQLGTGARSLEESMPSNCDKSSSGNYAVRHNPEAYYTNLNGACSTNDVPLGSTPNISAKFTFITPNLCDDGHDCSTAHADDWLGSWLGRIVASPSYDAGATAVFVTWDEGLDGSSNRVATVVIAPSVTPGTRDATHLTHYSLLRTAELLLGLPLLGHAKTAHGMRGML
jgi:phosphatidylinositol-3-phosphatase